MARSFNTTVKYKRNRMTVIKSGTKAVRQDRTKVIATEVSEYHDMVQDSERRAMAYGYGGAA